MENKNPNAKGGDSDLFKNERINKLEGICKKETKNGDEKRFLELYFEKYLPHAKKFWRSLPNDQAQIQIANLSQWKMMQNGDCLINFGDNINCIWILISGSVKVEFETKDTSDFYEDMLCPIDMMNSKSKIKIVATKNSSIISIDYGKAQKIIEECQSKLEEQLKNILSKAFTKIGKALNTEKSVYLKLFQHKSLPVGKIVCLPKDALTDFILLATGSFVLFIINDIQKEYNQKILLLNVMQGGTALCNEKPILLEKDSIYGVVACSENCQILTLSSLNFPELFQPADKEELRGQLQAKERMLGMVIDKISSMKIEDLQNHQKQIAEKAGIKLDQLLEQFETENKGKNLKKFEQLISKNQKVGGIKSEAGERVSKDIGVTPMLHSKDSKIKAMSYEQQKALIGLRNQGLMLRQGKPLSEQPETNLSTGNAQSRLLNLERKDISAQKKSMLELSKKTPAELYEKLGESAKHINLATKTELADEKELNFLKNQAKHMKK